MTWLSKVTLETVIVHTEGGSLKGVVAAVHDDCLVLRDVLVYGSDPQPELLDGNLVVPREKVMYIQKLPPGE